MLVPLCLQATFPGSEQQRQQHAGISRPLEPLQPVQSQSTAGDTGDVIHTARSREDDTVTRSQGRHKQDMRLGPPKILLESRRLIDDGNFHFYMDIERMLYSEKQL